MKVFLVLCFVSCVVGGHYDAVDMEDVIGANIPVTVFPSSGERSKRNYSPEELEKCEQMFGKYVDGVFVGIPTNCTMEKILEGLGGFPGRVNVTRRSNVPTAPVKNPNKRPLEDAPEPYWVYSYNVTDYKTYFRAEHAVRRFAGTPKEFLDVRGTMGWIQPDFCGQMRIGEYRLDDTGFEANLDHVACHLFDDPKRIIACKKPPKCATVQGGKISCVR